MKWLDILYGLAIVGAIVLLVVLLIAAPFIAVFLVWTLLSPTTFIETLTTIIVSTVVFFIVAGLTWENL